MKFCQLRNAGLVEHKPVTFNVVLLNERLRIIFVRLRNNENELSAIECGKVLPLVERPVRDRRLGLNFADVADVLILDAHDVRENH